MSAASAYGSSSKQVLTIDMRTGDAVLNITSMYQIVIGCSEILHLAIEVIANLFSK